MNIIIIILTVMLFTSSVFAEGLPNHRNAVAKVHDRLLFKEECENENCIVQALIEDYGRRNSIAPTDAEFDLYVAWFEAWEKKDVERRRIEVEKLEKELASGKLSDRQKTEKQAYLKTLRHLTETDKEIADLKLKMGEKKASESFRGPAKLFVGRWKIMNALYDRYKGRIAITKFGPVPVDAIRSMIAEEEEKGGFKIFDRDVEEKFRKSLETDSVKLFYEQEKGEAELARPPWIDKDSGQQ